MNTRRCFVGFEPFLGVALVDESFTDRVLVFIQSFIRERSRMASPKYKKGKICFLENDAEQTRLFVMRARANKRKNPHAVALGSLGGAKGGKARAAKLSAKELSDQGRKAVQARWKKARKS
jgi:hypothetical protein